MKIVGILKLSEYSSFLQVRIIPHCSEENNTGFSMEI
jgi:hypothetical protein